MSAIGRYELLRTPVRFIAAETLEIQPHAGPPRQGNSTRAVTKPRFVYSTRQPHEGQFHLHTEFLVLLVLISIDVLFDYSFFFFK